MESDRNYCILEGKVVRMKSKTLANNRPVANFELVSYRYFYRIGEEVKEANVFKVEAFEDRAIRFLEEVKVGDRIRITGRFRSYQNIVNDDIRETIYRGVIIEADIIERMKGETDGTRKDD